MANILNAGGGHSVGVFTNQGVALRATTDISDRMPPATRSGAITLMPPNLPTLLELHGPALNSLEVRGVPFVQQPIVRIVGVDGRVYTDVTGSIQIGAFGPCVPQISGQTSAPLVNGVATFTDAMISTVACLGQDGAFGPHQL